MTERKVIGCKPAKWGAAGNIDGSQVIDADCGHEVFAAPSTLTALKEKPFETMCIPCLTSDPEFAEAKQVPTIAVLEGVREELAAGIGESAVDEAFRTLGIKETGEQDG